MVESLQRDLQLWREEKATKKRKKDEKRSKAEPAKGSE